MKPLITKDKEPGEAWPLEEGFEVGDEVWYRNYGHADPPVPAVITSRCCSQQGRIVAYTCRRKDTNFDSWGDQHQFTPRQNEEALP